MGERACDELLAWALPQMGMRWRGFRRVRGQVCKRIARRCREIGVADAAAYRGWLESHPEEWRVLDGLCRVSISRFWRDRRVFETLAAEVLPALAERTREGKLRALSAGCASGEEPYSLVLAWRFGPNRNHLGAAERFPAVDLEVIAMDADAHMIDRARRARYSAATLRELPPHFVERAFLPDDDDFSLSDEYRAHVTLVPGDIRNAWPEGPFHIVLCRNLAFTYLDEPGQHAILDKVFATLTPGGALVVGTLETMPPDPRFMPWPGARAIFLRS